MHQGERIKLLLMMMPATNAVIERSFSGLKRAKTYLRSTTCNSRLNQLMMLHVHKDSTDHDANNLVDAVNEFVGDKDRRKTLFGRLTANNITDRWSFESRSTQTS
jgi:hypothetical protein